MKVAIVGAGIAGLSTAWSLAKQGFEVALFEQGSIPKALILSPCSGHGYKFGAAVGSRVADAVLDGDADRLARWLRAEDFSPRKAA